MTFEEWYERQGKNQDNSRAKEAFEQYEFFKWSKHCWEEGQRQAINDAMAFNAKVIAELGQWQEGEQSD